jgi:hypothetical protein
MYCNSCGQALVAGQAFCPRCGYASGMQPPPASPRRWMPAGLPLGLVERRVNALALGWLIYAAVIGLLGFFGLVFAHAVLSGHMGPFWHGPFESGQHFGHHWSGPGMPLFFLHFAWVALLIRFGLALAAGLGLMQKAPWGRWVAIVAGCLALIHLPFGTVLGVWTLVVLLNAPNALGYDVMARG